LLKRDTVAANSPELLAAVEGLAVHWREDPIAQQALALAAASSDPEISAAAAMSARASGANQVPVDP
jgi:hypothetical protein